MEGTLMNPSSTRREQKLQGKGGVAFHHDKKEPRSSFTDGLTDKELSNY